jgi:hypothetical protein
VYHHGTNAASTTDDLVSLTNTIQSRIELTKQIIWKILVQLMEEKKHKAISSSSSSSSSSLTLEEIKHFLVVKVDVFFMANIVFFEEISSSSTTMYSSSLFMSMLSEASTLLYEQIPTTFQLQKDKKLLNGGANSSSLERALCICVVRMLPNLVLLHEGFNMTGRNIRYQLFRVALSWFCSEDSVSELIIYIYK